MCAINGITEINEVLVRRMNALTAHRGPDATAVLTFNDVTLGHNRLAIIDLTEAGEQPMVSHDGRHVIVYNGELYNYLSLKNELSATYEFKTQSDTEVLLAALIVWGAKAFLRFRGIFAFAFYDCVKKELILARDHMGVKPLYYEIQDGVLRFSSELKAMVDEGASLDHTALSLYLSLGYVPSPHSLIRGIHKLPPGHFLSFREGIATVNRYYHPLSSYAKNAHASLYETIDASVASQLVSERPYYCTMHLPI
jgi:asparagine synthase (glutamine-hydrolysing)